MKFKKNFIGQDGFQWWIGVVEDRNDPEKIGRCRVRIFGIHTDDIVSIPTEDLPWAVPVYSVNNNDSFATPKEGEYVVGFFLDGSFCQSPAILGVIPGYNKQVPPEGRGFGDLRTPNAIRNSPKKPSALDYPEARTGHPTAISGNIVNDGIGLEQVVYDNIILHVPLVLKAKPSLTEAEQNVVGYDHKFTQRELNQGYITLRDGEVITILGIKGSDTVVSETQAKILLEIDIAEAIARAKDSIGLPIWETLNIPQKAGLSLNAYHLGNKVNFEESGVRSAITSGDVIRASQLLSAEVLKSPTGKYLRSEDTLAHVAASLFKSIPRSVIMAARKNDAINTTPMIVAGSGVGIQVHESNLSEDSAAKSLKYPTPEEIGKASLTDLATLTEKTLVQKFRERTLVSAIGVNGESWSEPLPLLSSEYPHNKAKETESGHIFEMDDTPGNERVHLAHRSGSFVEFYPSGTKVEKVVKNNYKIVMSDDHLYVAGKVNVVLESDAFIKVVGNCNLQIENNLECNVSGSMNIAAGDGFNVKANTMNFDIANTSTFIANNHYISIDNKLTINSNTSNISTANDLTLYSKSNLYQTVVDTSYHKSSNIRLESSNTTSVNSIGAAYLASSDILNLKGSSSRLTGMFVEINGVLAAGNTNMYATGLDSNGDSHSLVVMGTMGTAAADAYASVSSNVAIDANTVIEKYYTDNLTDVEIASQLNATVSYVREIIAASAVLSKPGKKGTPTAAQRYLESDRVVKINADINIQNNNTLKNYLNNPYNYPSTYGNVKRYIAPTIKSGSDLIFKNRVGNSLILINETANISKWLDKQLSLAANGYWRETGIELNGTIQPSNANIVDLWRNLGFTREYWTLSDQTNWAIAFVNFGLKQNGYRYVQTPNPRDVEIRLEDYRFTRIKTEDAQPGDVVLWANDHVNFVYGKVNGVLNFVGGTQPPAASLDIGDGRIGDVSLIDSGGCPIVAILRPSKA